jgi:RNA polymerase-binding transcription factor DksA
MAPTILATRASPTRSHPSNSAKPTHDSVILQQVRDALTRLDAGTFDACFVDGGPIEAQRLDAVPWTAYCLEHEQFREAATSPSMPTLVSPPRLRFARAAAEVSNRVRRFSLRHDNVA